MALVAPAVQAEPEALASHLRVLLRQPETVVKVATAATAALVETPGLHLDQEQSAPTVMADEVAIAETAVPAVREQ